MSNISSNGKYRIKPDWSGSNFSSSSLVDISEIDGNESFSSSELPDPSARAGSGRRKSVAFGSLMGIDMMPKNQRRRRSIATSLFGRKQKNSQAGGSTYESTVIREKLDGSGGSCDILYEAEPKYYGDGGANASQKNSNKNESRSRGKKNELSLPEEDDANDNGNDSDWNQNNNRGYTREKRHSWWNIFVPDQIKTRSRRLSHDVSFMSGSVDSLQTKYKRNKSKSIDHGRRYPLAADGNGHLTKEELQKKLPTILYTVENSDTLRSVAARFDTTPSELTQLNRLNSSFIYPGQQILIIRKTTNEEDADASNATSASAGDEDDDEKCTADADSKADALGASADSEILDRLRPTSPKPGHLERVTETPSADKDEAIKTQRFLKINVRHITDGQGVVAGVLLVTPNAVMFDPNVSDPLVIEHGPESYGVIAPIDLVVNAAIFHDIAHMRITGAKSCFTEKVEIYYPESRAVTNEERFEDPECSKDAEEDEAAHKQGEEESAKKGKDDDSQKETDEEEEKIVPPPDRRMSTLDHHWAIPKEKKASISEETDQPTIQTQPSAEGDQLCGNSSTEDIESDDILSNIQPITTKKVLSDADIVLTKDWVPPKPISQVTASPPSPFFDLSARSDSLDTKKKPIDKLLKSSKRLSYPLSWEGLTGSSEDASAPPSADSTQSVFSKVFSSSPIALVSGLGGNLFFKTPSEDSSEPSQVSLLNTNSAHSASLGRPSLGAFIRSSSPDTSQSSSSLKTHRESVEAKLDCRSMVSIDDMPELFASFDKLVPKPARACQDPPLYLRLRMGKPIGKAIPLPSSVMSYGKSKLRPEYWFSVPKNRTEELYKFINVWIPHIYGKLDEEEIKQRGFELIKHDTEWTKESVLNDAEESEKMDELTQLTRESWEVVSTTSDENRKPLASSSFDFEFPLPDLIGKSEILTVEHREKLSEELPARAEGYAWTLVFSTSQNGFSLNSIYRKMQKLESPILMVIDDTENNVFGALTSCSFHVSDHFYGTGESFLYKFNPAFKVFHWTGENQYFIKGNPQSLSIGADDGRFGIWLDGDLNQGRTQSCSTYGNEPLAPEDFTIKTLECWAFI